MPDVIALYMQDGAIAVVGHHYDRYFVCHRELSRVDFETNIIDLVDDTVDTPILEESLERGCINALLHRLHIGKWVPLCDAPSRDYGLVEADLVHPGKYPV